MSPITRAVALLGCLALSACGEPIGHPAHEVTLPLPSPELSAPTPSSDGEPAYGLLNDTAAAVTVTGCGPACPRNDLLPGAELEFALGNGRVTVHLAGGTLTCLLLVNGVRHDPPLPRQRLRINTNTSPAVC